MSTCNAHFIYFAANSGNDDVSALTSQNAAATEGTKCFIPFSQRQSKSAVAAYQALKKRNKVCRYMLHGNDSTIR